MSDHLGQLTRVNAGVPSVYDRIADPLPFITEMGKVFWHAKACGCQTEAEGKLLALACMSERMNPFEINKTYHLMDGKLSMRADAMLAKFRQLGGKFRWIKDGEDAQSASLELTYDGNTITCTYSIEQAKQAGLVKDKGNWAKDPASMLRARVISRGIRMIAPEVIAGTYTPEEISDFTDSDNAPVENTSTPKPRGKKEKTSGTAGDVIDAEFTIVSPATPAAQPEAAPVIAPATASKAEEPPFETKQEASQVTAATTPEASVSNAGETSQAPKDDLTMLLIDIGLTAVKAGYGTKSEEAVAALEAGLQKNRPGLKLDSLAKPQLEALLKNLQAKIDENKGK